MTVELNEPVNLSEASIVQETNKLRGALQKLFPRASIGVRKYSGYWYVSVGKDARFVIVTQMLHPADCLHVILEHAPPEALI